MSEQFKINKMKSLNYIIMRKLVFALLMLMTLSLNAQDYNTIKFMGIPVDGSKSEMISQLEEKGFTVFDELRELEKSIEKLEGKTGVDKIRNSDGDYYMSGYFDGKSSLLVLSSYNNKVYQIMVINNSPYNELNGKIQFNSYVDQLNKKYTNPIDYDYSIDLDKDLSAPYENNIRAFFTTAHDENDKPHGMVAMEMSHPKYKEFYIAIRYYNADNMPNGDDL